MLERDFYLQKLIRNMWNGEVKVITGLRRCGKSVLLFTLFDRYLREQGVSDDDIIRIELDQRKNARYRNPVTLCDYVEGIVTQALDHKYYLLIDEVQMCQKVKDKESGSVVSMIDFAVCGQMSEYGIPDNTAAPDVRRRSAAGYACRCRSL